MEDNKPTTQTPAEADEMLAKAKAQKKRFTIIFVSVVVVLIAAMVIFMIVRNGSNKADELVGKADIAAANVNMTDSLAMDSVLNLYKVAADKGYKSGNRAKLEAAIILYNQGKNEEAIAYLEDASIDDDIIAAGAKSLLGDCYANLEKYDDAIKAYDAAVKKADKNPMVVPYFLVKKANVLRAQKNYAAEAETFKQIVDEYPQYSDMHGIERYYERAAASK